ncbi:MAG: hypothetical protein JXR48_07885 [Candidatus Delongbacteria bacterium]|nr:hypothetical protein [Candidatus Delongbacteria bacterium]
MENQAPYHKLLKTYHTPNETIKFPSKRMGDRIVPLGCFYDPGDRYDALIIILNQQILPLLNQLDRAIMLKYQNIEIYYESNVCGNFIKGFTFRELIDKAIYEITGYGDHIFDLVLNITITRDKYNDLDLWGTQTHIYYDEVRWFDKEVEDEFPVWFLSIENETLILEKDLEQEQTKNIINSILDNIEMDYKLSYL